MVTVLNDEEVLPIHTQQEESGVEGIEPVEVDDKKHEEIQDQEASTDEIGNLPSEKYTGLFYIPTDKMTPLEMIDSDVELDEFQQSLLEGISFLNDGHLESAVDLLTKSLEVEATVEAYLFRADAYLYLERYLEAYADCVEVLQVDKENVTAMLMKAFALENTGMKELAIVELLSARSKLQNLQKKLPLPKEIEEAQKRINASMYTYLSRGIERPRYLYCTLMLGDLLKYLEYNEKVYLSSELYEQGRLQELSYHMIQAIVHYELSIDLLPNPDAHAGKGRALFWLERFVDAYDESQKALKLDKNFVAALIVKANVFHTLKYFKEAVDVCEKVLNLEPKNSEAQLIYNSAYPPYHYNQQYLKNAKHHHDDNTLKDLEEFKKRISKLSLADKKKCSYKFYKQAVSAYEDGQYFDGWLANQYSIHAFPNASAQHNRALCAYHLHWYTWAVADCEFILIREEKHVNACITKSMALQKLGKLTEAEGFLYMALLYEPGNKRAQKYLAKLEILKTQEKIESVTPKPTKQSHKQVSKKCSS